jgi:hypothetical protein
MTDPALADGQLIWRHLWTYCTSLFGVGQKDGKPFAHYVGSGTFVRFGGMPCLLTAAHVWAEPGNLAKYFAAGFATDVDVNLMKVPTDLLKPLFVSTRKGDAWGPDIALVRIPDVKARELELRKAFYDLTRNRTDALSAGGQRLWGFIGATGEGSDFSSPDEALLKNRQFTTRQPRKSTHDGLEYIEVTWNIDNPDAPTTWGGVSGAGLWLVDPAVNSGVLTGLAFVEQRAQPAERGFVRCHSRQDVERSLSAAGR